MMYSLDAHMRIASIAWSPDGRYISALGSGTSQLQLMRVDNGLYERILSVHDAASRDKNFWANTPIDLTEINEN